MKKLILFALMCLSLLCISMSVGQPAYVTAYYPTWSYCSMSPSDVDYSALTHIIIFSADIDTSKSPYFAPVTRASDSTSLEFGVPNPNCSPQGKWGKPVGYSYIQWVLDEAHPKNVKVLLCIGGIWGTGADRMKWVISNPTRRAAYIQAVVAYCFRKGVDGVDVDLEHPNGSTRDYMTFMKELRAEFDRVYTTHAIISIAAGAWTDNNAYKPYSELFTYIDQCNLMSYDFSGGSQAWFNSGIGNNTVLYPFTGPSASPSSWWNWQNHGVDQWIALGAPANKMAMGIPFYSWKFSGPTKVGDPIGGRWYGTYTEAITKRANASLSPTYIFDDSAKSPILTYTEGGVKYYITYDDTNSIQYKVDRIKQKHVGAMIYELWSGWVNNAPIGQKDPLLQAFKRAFGGPIIPPPPPPITMGVVLSSANLATLNIGSTITFNTSITKIVPDSSISYATFNGVSSVVSKTLQDTVFYWTYKPASIGSWSFKTVGWKGTTQTTSNVLSFTMLDTTVVPPPPPPVTPTAAVSVSKTNGFVGDTIIITGISNSTTTWFDLYIDGVFYNNNAIRQSTTPCTFKWKATKGTHPMYAFALVGSSWIKTATVNVTIDTVVVVPPPPPIPPVMITITSNSDTVLVGSSIAFTAKTSVLSDSIVSYSGLSGAVANMISKTISDSISAWQVIPQSVGNFETYAIAYWKDSVKKSNVISTTVNPLPIKITVSLTSNKSSVLIDSVVSFTAKTTPIVDSIVVYRGLSDTAMVRISNITNDSVYIWNWAPTSVGSWITNVRAFLKDSIAKSSNVIIVVTAPIPPTPIATASISVSSTNVVAGESINIYGAGNNIALLDVYINGVFYKRFTKIPFTEIWRVARGTTKIGGYAQATSAAGGRWITLNNVYVTGTRTSKTGLSAIAYPNPFNPTTTVEINLDAHSYVTSKIYNVYGQEVASLIDESLSEGVHYAKFNASSLPSGVYYCRTVAGNEHFHIKLLLLK